MTLPAGWRPCSDMSRERVDAMYGTASAGSAWLMLELCGAWGPSAFMDSPSVVDPGLGRAIVRTVGLALAIIPLFAGFLPALFDERRRALPDYLAGTTVDYEEARTD